MMLRLSLVVALLLPGLSLPRVARAQAQADTLSTQVTAAADSLAEFAPEKHFARAALEVTGVNVGVWLYCRYIREGGENTGFRIGIQSWKDNLLNGFEWDDNQFKTNQLAHPYHGSMYFCSARANGYDYWESTAFSFAGSLMWEYFGETHNPSINDLVSTGYGGVAFGEMLHRFSEKILDDEATGAERNWRELGGLVVNPMGGINRLITGEFTRVGPNPRSRGSEAFRANWRFGSRFTGEGTLTNADTVRAFMRLRGMYGDQAGGEIKKPFDAFSFDLQFNFQDAAVLGRAQVQGVLRSWEMSKNDRTSWYFAAVNHYDYINNWAYVYGGQSLGAAVLTRVKSRSWTVDAGLTATWIILGGTSSDHASYTGRSYDYGPGAGGKFFAVMRRQGHNILGLESDLYYLRIMNGTEANHLVRETRLTAGLPVRGAFGFGAEFSMYNADRRYADYPDVSTKDPQATVYLSLML